MRASARGFGTKVARAHVMNEHVKRGNVMRGNVMRQRTRFWHGQVQEHLDSKEPGEMAAVAVAVMVEK